MNVTIVTQPALLFLSECCNHVLRQCWICEEKAECGKCGVCAICGPRIDEVEVQREAEQRRNRR